MPVKWRVTLTSRGSQPNGDGTIAVNVNHNGDQSATSWRASFVERGRGTRIFGVCRPTVCDTVRLLLGKIAAKLARGERQRVLELALRHDLQPGSQPTGIHGSSSGPPIQAPASGQGSRNQGLGGAQLGLSANNVPELSANNAPVAFIHQIYGLYRDGKPMNARFVESQRRWEQLAVSIGARYHLWNADEVDTLIRTRFKFMWDTYQNVRFPVMRADIGRVAILHEYGGLYSDLDVFPNRPSYRQVPLAICMRPNRSKKPGSQPTFLDMEVIVGKCSHPVLIGWLVFVRGEIERVQYDTGFFKTARARYVLITTGPLAMQRFLRHDLSKKWLDIISYLQSSTSEEGDTATLRNLDKYDVVSFTSNTYFTTAHRLPVAVAATNVPLPSRDPPRRRKRKSATGIQAHSQRLTHSQALARSQHERDVALEAADAARLEVDAAVQREDAALRERDAAISRLDAWVGVAMAMRNTTSGRTFLEQCTPEMREEVKRPTPGAERYSRVFFGGPPPRASFSHHSPNQHHPPHAVK